jgi:membrane protease YdiL (CAAX protease family)
MEFSRSGGFVGKRFAYIFFIVAFTPTLYPGLFEGLYWMDSVLHNGSAHISAAALYAAASLYLFFSLFRASGLGCDPARQFTTAAWRAHAPLFSAVIIADLLIGWIWIHKTTALKATETLELLIRLSASDPVPALLLGIAFSSFAEELLVRGIFQGYLQKHFGWKAVFMTSLFFALAHYGRGLTGLFFIMSILYGFLYYRTKSLVWPSLVHAIHNIFFVVLLPRL